MRGGRRGWARRILVDKILMDDWRASFTRSSCYCDGSYLYGTNWDRLDQVRKILNAEQGEKTDACLRFRLDSYQVSLAERRGVAMVRPAFIDILIRKRVLV